MALDSPTLAAGRWATKTFRFRVRMGSRRCLYRVRAWMRDFAVAAFRQNAGLLPIRPHSGEVRLHLNSGRARYKKAAASVVVIKLF